MLSSSTNTSHPLRGSLSSFGANPTTRAFLQALFNWFHLTQTSDGVSFIELRDTGPPLHALPLRGPPAEPVQEFVCGISLIRASRVTSTPPRFESDPRWQLLGECRDVSIRLSKEIAPGSSRSLRANQTLHAAPTDALSPAPNCRGVKGGWERRRGGQAGTPSSPISLNKLPELGSRAHLYGYGYFYKASARLFTSLAKLLRESRRADDF